MIKVFQICAFLILNSLVYGQHQPRFLVPNDFEKSFKSTPEAVLIDLRTSKEFASARIKKAVNIDFMMEGFDEYMSKRYAKNQALFLYSQSGEDAENASQYLSEIGFKNITALKGGFEKWITSSKPYISGSPNFVPQNIYNTEIFAKKIKENKYVLVDFYADWCGPCKKMAPVLYDIDIARTDVNLFKIDADQNQTLVREFEVSEIPTLILFRYGKQIWRTTGITDAKDILSKMP